MGEEGSFDGPPPAFFGNRSILVRVTRLPALRREEDPCSVYGKVMVMMRACVTPLRLLTLHPIVPSAVATVAISGGAAHAASLSHEEQICIYSHSVGFFLGRHRQAAGAGNGGLAVIQPASGFRYRQHTAPVGLLGVFGIASDEDEFFPGS